LPDEQNVKPKFVAQETLPNTLNQKLKKIVEPFIGLQIIYRLLHLITVIQANPDKKIRSVSSGKRRILCVGDPDGRLKFLEVYGENKNLEFIWFPRRVTSMLQTRFAKIKKTVGLGEWRLDPYYDDEIVSQKGRAKLRSKQEKLLRDCMRLWKAECLVLPKLNDEWIVDLQLAAKNINLPIIVTDRESSISPKRMEVYPPLLYPLREHLNLPEKVCVNTEKQYEFMVKAGVEKEKLIITGAPQSDYWSNPVYSEDLPGLKEKLDKNKKQILYLGFGTRAYLNFYYPGDERTWDELCYEVHSTLADFLIENSDEVEILYKIGSKPARDYWHGYDAFYQRLKEAGVESSLIEVKGAILTPEILEFTDLTIAFQTTGVIEVMFEEDQPIVVVGWGEFFNDIKDTLLPLYNCGVHHADSPENLMSLLNKLLSNSLPNMDRSKFEELKYEYFYLCDGNASNRILDEIIKVIEK